MNLLKEKAHPKTYEEDQKELQEYLDDREAIEEVYDPIEMFIDPVAAWADVSDEEVDNF